MTGPTEAPERPSPRPSRPPLGRPTPTAGPAKRKTQPPVIAAGGMLVVLGFLALTSWVGLLWAGIATGVAAVAGTGAVGVVKKRRNGLRRTGGSGGGLFPGLGRRRAARRGVPGSGSASRRIAGPTRSGSPTRRPTIGKRTGLGTGKSTGGASRSKGGLRGLFGKSSAGNGARPARSAGGSRNPFNRNRGRTGTGSGSPRAAGQSRFRNPFKGSKGAATSGRPSTPGSGRSRNPFKRSTGTGSGASARSTGARMRNPFKRSGTGTGNASRSRIGSPVSRGTGMPGRRSRNPFKRTSGSAPKGTTPGRGVGVPRGTAPGRPSRNPFKRRGTPATSGTGSTSTGTPSRRRGPGGLFKRSKGGTPMKATTPSNYRIKRGTKPPPPPTRAQVREGIRVQKANQIATARKASGRPVSGWLGRLGQPKPPKPGVKPRGPQSAASVWSTSTKGGPAKAIGRAPVPAAPQAAWTSTVPAPERSAPFAQAAARDRQNKEFSDAFALRAKERGEAAARGTAPSADGAVLRPQRQGCPDHGANCTVDHEANRYGHKHDQPGRVPTTGGKRMTNGSARDYDDMSLVGFVNAQGDLHQKFAEAATEAKKMLAGADNQPLAPEVRANLEAVVVAAGALESVSEALVPTARRHHEADFARAEEPRGSRKQEKAADVAKAEADGF